MRPLLFMENWRVFPRSRTVGHDIISTIESSSNPQGMGFLFIFRHIPVQWFPFPNHIVSIPIPTEFPLGNRTWKFPFLMERSISPVLKVHFGDVHNMEKHWLSTMVESKTMSSNNIVMCFAVTASSVSVNASSCPASFCEKICYYVHHSCIW